MDEYGIWRDLETGVDPTWAYPEDADGATDQNLTTEPVYTRLEGPYGIPWFEGIEAPFAPSGLFKSPDPSMPFPDAGAEPIVGPYEPAVRTHGPVVQWGHEASGGLNGDQAIGRIMRFPANLPQRYDANGVWVGDYKDELAAIIAANGQEPISDGDMVDSLLNWQGI